MAWTPWGDVDVFKDVNVGSSIGAIGQNAATKFSGGDADWVHGLSDQGGARTTVGNTPYGKTLGYSESVYNPDTGQPDDQQKQANPDDTSFVDAQRAAAQQAAQQNAAYDTYAGQANDALARALKAFNDSRATIGGQFDTQQNVLNSQRDQTLANVGTQRTQTRITHPEA